MIKVVLWKQSSRTSSQSEKMILISKYLYRESKLMYEKKKQNNKHALIPICVNLNR